MRNLILTLVTAVTVAACGGGGSDPLTVEQLVVETDQFDRVVHTNKLKEVECPQEATAVFIAGQSNAANHSRNAAETTSPYVLQYFNGRCYVGASPVLGGTGIMNNPFHAVMMDYQKRIGGTVVYSVFAVGGQPISKFSTGGVYNESLRNAYSGLNNKYPIKYFLWQQGESDASARIPGDQYTNSWNALISSVNIQTPLLARSTICFDLSPYDTAVGLAQDSLRARLGGPDTDYEISFSDRYDRCHFGSSGVAKLSELWNAYLH